MPHTRAIRPLAWGLLMMVERTYTEESTTSDPSGDVDGPPRTAEMVPEITPNEQLPNGQPATPRLDSNSPISQIYLTFDTNLPSPQQSGYLEGKELPPRPDLKAYTSPLTWNAGRKSILLILSCAATFLTAYTAGSYSPPAAIMAQDFGTTKLVVLVGITTFCLGFAFFPMALAPMSEIWGRYPIFIIAGAVFVIFQAVCSAMTNVAGMLIARFLVGAGASVFSAVVGGVLTDLWEKHERNTPMALFSGAVLAGTGAGPLASAAFLEIFGNRSLAWQWIFWVQVIMDGALLACLVFFFKESRASVLLSRKAKKLNRWYEELEKCGVYGLWLHDDLATAASALSSVTTINPDIYNNSGDKTQPSSQLRRIRWLVEEDEQRASLGQIIATSIKRPFHLLFTEPVIFSFSLWAAFSWGVLYLSFSVVPFLYAENFNMSSRVYAAMMVASAVATCVGVCQESLLKHPQWKRQPDGFQYANSGFWTFLRRRFPAEAPEARLYFTCITAMLLPAGLFIAFLGSMEGYLQAVGLGLATWGIYSVYLASFNYLADSYHIYASSALAAQSFCRNVLGGCFPLLTNIMFTNLGIKGAGGMLGGIATLLTFIPWVLLFFGERIRAKSKMAITLQK